MKEITTLNIYLLFIIIIIIIAIVYIQQKKSVKRIENFDDATDTDTETITTSPQIDYQRTTPTIGATSFNNINIQDSYTKNIVVQSLKDLEMGLDRYSYLDAPVIVNDEGKICMNWGNYSNGKYSVNENKCIVPDSSGTVRKCLNITGSLSSCDLFYNDGYIERMNTININPLVEQTKAAILYNIGNNNLDLVEKNKELDKTISDLITKRNLEIQQLYFINYNTNNLSEKQKNIDKINKIVSDKQTEVNLNQVSFSQFLETNNSNEKLAAIYYKIAIGLIISIIIMGILSVLFSNIL
jgi:hypothetical protein